MTTPAVAAPALPTVSGGRARPRKGRRLLNTRDRIALAVMITLPALFVLFIVWLPAFGTVLFSFTNWNGISRLDTIDIVGLQNYVDVAGGNYPPFWIAVRNNALWLAVFFVIATPLGMFLAVLLDRDLKGVAIYRSVFYMPVVLSLALIGFIWQLIYSRDQGVLNAVIGYGGAEPVDWFGDRDVNIWAVLVAASWRHVGYIMLLYLAGLKAVDPTLKEAAAVDGASETRTFFSVVFPALAPINIVVFVITVIESLRAFDLVWIINKGRNGLEVLSALVTANLIGEATQVGFGSAIATILLGISLIFIIIYLINITRQERDGAR